MFRVSIINSEMCDKCNKSGGTKDDPLISLSHKTRQEHNIIFVHDSCLTRAVGNAKQEMLRS